MKKLGPIGKNDGIQIIRELGDVSKRSLQGHMKETSDLFNKPEENEKSDEPTDHYYTSDLLANDDDEIGRPEGDETLIQSVTIKRDPTNALNNNKTVDQVFKSEEEDEPGVTPKYFACKVLGDSKFKNPDLSKLQIYPVEKDLKLDDLYKHIKTNGGGLSTKPGTKDGIQIFKVTGDVDTPEISKHLLKSRVNAPTDEPSTNFYQNKVLGDSTQKDKPDQPAKPKGLIKSVTIKIIVHLPGYTVIVDVIS